MNNRLYWSSNILSILAWISAWLVILMGIYTTFGRWGIEKKKRFIFLAIFTLIFALLGTLLKNPEFALMVALAIMGICFPLPLHRLRVLDGLGMWMPIGLAILLYGLHGTHHLQIMMSQLLLLIGFIGLRQGYTPRFYKHFGQLWFVSLFMCSVILLLTPTNQIENVICLVVATLGYVWVSFLKKSNEKPLLLFDLDGTLIDSQELVFETFRQVFKRRKPGYPLSEQELYSFFGPTLEESFSRYFPPDEVPEVIDLYQQINLDLHPTLLKTMPYAKETLKALHDQGYSLGIVSNKRRHPVEYGLRLTNLTPYFDQVFAKEDQPACKPNPDGLIHAATVFGYPLDQVVYVGDNGVDIQAARGAAFYSVGYTVDDTQNQSLQQQHPCRILTDLRQLPNVIEEETIWIDKSMW